jgi:hypothetical protein
LVCGIEKFNLVPKLSVLMICCILASNVML